MDPRKAATVTAPDMKRAFVEGFSESRQQSMNESAWHYLVRFLLNSVAIRERVYDADDSDSMWEDVVEHLRHGAGVEVSIAVRTNDELPDEDGPAELPAGHVSD